MGQGGALWSDKPALSILAHGHRGPTARPQILSKSRFVNG
jgi:hypothetical protein